MSLADLDALEEAILILNNARREVAWISASNPVWMTLYHAEMSLAAQFKEQFNFMFNEDERGDND